MDCKISVKINGASSNSEYCSDKYHQLGVNEKDRDNYFMYMTRDELMNYFYPDFINWISSGGSQNEDWYNNPDSKNIK